MDPIPPNQRNRIGQARLSRRSSRTAPVAAAAITPTMAATGSNTAVLDLMFMGSSFLARKGIGTGLWCKFQEKLR
jgi:hypothetical protein